MSFLFMKILNGNFLLMGNWNLQHKKSFIGFRNIWKNRTPRSEIKQMQRFAVWHCMVWITKVRFLVWHCKHWMASISTSTAWNKH